MKDGWAISVGDDSLEFFVEFRASCAAFEVIDTEGYVEVVERVCG